MLDQFAKIASRQPMKGWTSVKTFQSASNAPYNHEDEDEQDSLVVVYGAGEYLTAADD